MLSYPKYLCTRHKYLRILYSTIFVQQIRTERGIRHNQARCMINHQNHGLRMRTNARTTHLHIIESNWYNTVCITLTWLNIIFRRNNIMCRRSLAQPLVYFVSGIMATWQFFADHSATFDRCNVCRWLLGGHVNQSTHAFRAVPAYWANGMAQRSANESWAMDNKQTLSCYSCVHGGISARCYAEI